MKQVAGTFLLVIFFILIYPFGISAVDRSCFPEKNDSRLVYDISHLLSTEEDAMLENKLAEFARITSNQIVIVIVNDLCGMDKAQYATELGEAWGVGQKKEDNGIVILVKPKTSSERGETFIAIGRGLEGAIPDASTYLIVDNELIPYFKQGAYYDGLNNATNVLMQLARDEYSIDEYAKQNSRAGSKPKGAFLFIVFIVLIVLIARIFSVRRYARINHLNWWTAFWLLSSTRRSHGGYFGDFTRGGGGFGGDGGGFGGFGGGGFGGGGSGGSW